MTNIEYYKLVHHNYTRFCLLSLFTFCVSMVFCSYSYGAANFNTRVDCPIETSSLDFLDDCFFYHADNNLLSHTAINQCSWVLQNKSLCSSTSNSVTVVESIPGVQAQIDAGIASNQKLSSAVSKVFFHNTHCGINGGTFEDPKGSQGKSRCHALGKLAIASGVKYSDQCSLQPESKREACRSISDAVDRAKQCMVNMNNRVFCDELVSGFMSSDTCMADVGLCPRKISKALPKDSCQIGNYDREQCTGSKGGDLDCDSPLVPNSEGTQCVAKSEACPSGQEWNESTRSCEAKMCAGGQAIDPTGEGAVASNDGCGPGPGPSPNPVVDPTDPDNPDNPNNPNEETVTDNDIDQLSDMANNLGNSMFGNGAGGGGNIGGGSAELPDIDVKGNVDFGNFDGDSGIQRSGQVSGDGGYGTMPAVASLPLQAPPIAPGGEAKKTGGGGNAGGPRGGGAIGGANAGAGGRSAGRGGRKRRRGGRGMPYADIRKNMGGHVYHGAQGSGPGAATVAESKNKRKKKSKGKPGVPGTEANKNYQARLNNALQRKLTESSLNGSRAKHTRPEDVVCDERDQFTCIRKTADIIRSQGVLNAKGR